jgi:hypothetical protein
MSNKVNNPVRLSKSLFEKFFDRLEISRDLCSSEPSVDRHGSILFCFNSICGIIDQSTTMSSIDILYAQIFYKCKQFASQSPATGKSEINRRRCLFRNMCIDQRLYLRFDWYDFRLIGLHFPAFIEAFFLLSQRKYSTSCTLLDSVTELIKSCLHHLDLCVEEPV